MDIIPLTLPEWAFLSGSPHDESEGLDRRDVIMHVRTASVFEIFTQGYVALEDNIPQYKFIYHGIADEKMLVACHFAFVEGEELKELMRRCAQWYCDYSIKMDLDILHNEKTNE
jgi:hypothetical protein